jgi:hypothetical protein
MTVATSKTSAAKKSPSKRPATKATSAKKVSSRDEQSAPAKKTSRRSVSAPRAAADRRRSGAEISALAAREIHELTGREVECVTSLRRQDDEWRVEVEVLELSRIPDTTDLLALYEVELDESGDLQTFRRVRRYVRGTPDDG